MTKEIKEKDVLVLVPVSPDVEVEAVLLALHHQPGRLHAPGQQATELTLCGKFTAPFRTRNNFSEYFHANPNPDD